MPHHDPHVPSPAEPEQRVEPFTGVHAELEDLKQRHEALKAEHEALLEETEDHPKRRAKKHAA